jgi:PII-like signaling protein
MERELSGPNTLLRIFMGESQKSGMEPLYWDIVKRARNKGLAGCTVFRGIAGFGASSVIHKASLSHLFSADLPIVIEIVDTKDHIRDFLKEVKPLLGGSLVTEEQVQVHHYQAAPKSK